MKKRKSVQVLVSPELSNTRAKKLIEQLSSPDPRVVEKARKALLAYAKKAKPITPKQIREIFGKPRKK